MAVGGLQLDGETAREHVACWRTCGESEIGSVGRPGARGCAYFHTQCTESAAAGHGLTLLYGGFDGEGDTTAAVGHALVSALGQVGLRTDWQMGPSRAIIIPPGPAPPPHRLTDPPGPGEVANGRGSRQVRGGPGQGGGRAIVSR
ncbi:DUF6891 domain-containing protein [Streptomyces erythrochromogenes]|uniref:DUF6891 domain-containing protein n=1 Tax=Streptomyces erythrochromogenes TaxID=285574 RepID=UPI003828846C